MKTYKVYDDRGTEIELSEAQLYRHIKLIFAPILSEIGMDGADIAKYGDDIYRLNGLIIAHIREQHSKLEVARQQYLKLRDQRDRVFDFIDRFLGHTKTENIVELEERRKAA